MASHYVDVTVEEHPEIPDGCELRFHAVGEPRPVRRIRYEPLDGPEGEFEVVAAHVDGRESTARAVPVDDSGAGTSLLIYGGPHGLRLRRAAGGAAAGDRGGDAGGGEAVAEPYLLLADGAIID